MLLRTETPTMSIMSDRLTTAVRLVLALSVLLITAVDPSDPAHSTSLTYSALALYILHSGILYALARRESAFLSARSVYWLDIGWYAGLMLLSGGTNSLFFYCFFFAILASSFHMGCSVGRRVALASAILYTLAGFAAVLAGWEFALNRFLLRLSFLLALGPMLVYWVGLELGVKRRLALLRDITRLSNPRFGVDHTLGALMERLRAFYDAETCVLIMLDQAGGGHHVRSANRREPERAVWAEPVGEELARRLLGLPAEHAAVYSSELEVRGWCLLRAREHGYNVVTGQRAAGVQTGSGSIAATLDVEAFVTVPLRYRLETVGRLYLGSHRRRAFNLSDIDFLLQVVEHTLPALDNIRLVDRLASDAAEEERQRIARDLHDSVIQPYIGLQMGLAAIRHKLNGGGAAVTADIERLIEVAELEVVDLRRYIYGLKDGGEREGSLLPAVQRFAAKFAEATGIAVHVEAGSGICVNDRMAAEVFQMVAEGLSNVRRHTQALRATVELARSNGHLLMRIANDGAPGSASSLFTPRSITARAAALGGMTRVERQGDTVAVVVVEIPL